MVILGGGVLLMSEVPLYLIVSDPPTFLLDQWKHPCRMLLHKLSFRKSESFTSDRRGYRYRRVQRRVGHLRVR